MDDCWHGKKGKVMCVDNGEGYGGGRERESDYIYIYIYVYTHDKYIPRRPSNVQRSYVKLLFIECNRRRHQTTLLVERQKGLCSCTRAAEIIRHAKNYRAIIPTYPALARRPRRSDRSRSTPMSPRYFCPYFIASPSIAFTAGVQTSPRHTR